MTLVAWKRRAEAVHFEDQVFEKLDLRSMNAFGSTWKNCIFRDCQMDLADWRGSKFEGCTFSRCEARLVNFSTSFFENTAFTGCNLEQASFMGSHLLDVKFNDCRMAYGETLFQNATAKRGVAFHGCNLHGSNLDFREVEPKSLRFDGCNLWGAKISMGCAIWQGTFDDRLVRQFLALIARVAQDPRIAELAGDQFQTVCRAMDGSKHERNSGEKPMSVILDELDGVTSTHTPIPVKV